MGRDGNRANFLRLLASLLPAFRRARQSPPRPQRRCQRSLRPTGLTCMYTYTHISCTYLHTCKVYTHTHMLAAHARGSRPAGQPPESRLICSATNRASRRRCSHSGYSKGTQRVLKGWRTRNGRGGHGGGHVRRESVCRNTRVACANARPAWEGSRARGGTQRVLERASRGTRRNSGPFKGYSRGTRGAA